MSPSVWKSLEGSVVDGRFRLKALIGMDPEGAVFRAERTDASRTTREAAVRLSAADEGTRQERWRDGSASAGARHPHLVECCGAGLWQPAQQKFFYLATELAEQQLADLIRLWPLRVSQARDMVKGVAAALCCLHGRPEPAVHGSVWPSNIMLAGGQWKLSEFGALPAGGPLEIEEFRDAAFYAPPEGLDGAVSPASDVWALGVLIVRAMTGAHPFQDDSELGLANAISTREPVIKMPLPAPFAEIVAGCLRKDPGLRWTAEQVLEAVTAGAPPEPAREVSADYRWVASAVGAVGVVAAIVLGTLLLWRTQDEKAPAPQGQAPQEAQFLRSTPVTSKTGPGAAGNLQAKVIRRVEPDYPEWARRAGIRGTVRLRLTVGKDGHVMGVNVVSGPSVLAGAATEAVRQWLFQPIVVKSETVAFQTEIDFGFGMR